MGNALKPVTPQAINTVSSPYISLISGVPQQIVYNRVDTRTSYSAILANIPGAVYGTEMSLLTTTITPKLVSSLILIELNISFEMQNDTVFRLVRSVSGRADVLVGNNSTDTGRWSGWAIPGYDVDDNSTPRTNHHILVDSPLTLLPVTYKFLVSSSDGNVRTLQLNRSTASAGQDSYEVGISQVVIWEIAV